MWIFWIVIVLFFYFLFRFATSLEKEGTEKTKKSFQSLPNYNPELIDGTGWNKPSISIEPNSRRFAIIMPNQQVKLYHFDQLIAVEIERDGHSISKSNRGSQVAGAAVGAIFLGPVGLLLGGLTGSKRHEEKIKRIVLKLYTNDLMDPVIEFPFMNEWIGYNADNIIVKNAAKKADEWYARFQAILQTK